MTKIRVAEDTLAYYIAVEPPLTGLALENLPDPYKGNGGAEAAGWPYSAQLNRHDKSEMVLGLLKDSLIVAEIEYRRNTIDREAYLPQGLVDYLQEITEYLPDVQFDSSVYDVAAKDDGTLVFVGGAREVALGQ